MKTQLYRNLVILAGILVLLLGTPSLGRAAPPAQGPPGHSDKTLVDRLNQESGGTVRISYHAETGKVRFIGTSPGRSIAQPSVLGIGTSPEKAARGFLAVYGKLFGLKDPNSELTMLKERTPGAGRAFVRFRQTYQGIPIVGGELIVQTGPGRDIISANGEVLPDLDLDVTPTINAETARQTALAKVAKDYDLSVDDLTATEPKLWIYNPALLGNPGRRVNTLVWRLEITPVEMLPIRELVLVDAQRGIVALHFNQVDTAKNRQIYDNQNNAAFGLPGNGPVRLEGGGATGVTDTDKAYDYAGDTYDFYATYHGRDSIDDAGMSLINTVRYCSPFYSCPYANAFWNGSQMVYGAGFPQADDVVAHELTHGVTDSESNLYYYMQSGAINEAFSDIWGEFVDQTNGAGNDSPGVKWQMGEDEPNSGVLRNMQYPTLFSDPDRVGSSNYHCDESDSGGVHSNSGIVNKTAYLLTDGDIFNGKTVTGLGITKAAKIFYEAQTNMVTSASDFNDLYDILPQACTNLVGTAGITAADCQEVQDAVDATEMNQQPASCLATEAPICPSGQSPTDLFFDDFEAGVSNWTSGANQGNDEWWYKNWYATSGFWHLWGWDQGYSSGSPLTADYWTAMTTDALLPGGTSYLHFNHSYEFEDDSWPTYYDGGVVEYSTNGGSSWNDAGALFTHNGYNGTISTCCSNPLANRSAFVAESNGYYSSRLDLSSLAGQNARFRFRIGTDPYAGDYGWFIDDVRIYTCAVGNTPPRYLSSGLSDQAIFINESRDNAINLWQYADDYETSDSSLTFTFCNTPDSGAGVTLDSNRFIDINPTAGWKGQTDVCVRVTDTGSLYAESTFTVRTQAVYLPVIIKNN